MNVLSVSILGGGLAGSLLSNLLAQQGHRVQLFEKRADPRQKAAIGGRSINLALSYRGWQALKKAKVSEAVAQQAIAMRGRMIHSQESELTFQPYGQADQAIYSVSREALNQLLVEQAERAGVHTFFQHACEGVNLEPGIPTIRNLADDTLLTPKADLLIGADGAYSVLRSEMQRTPRFDYSQHYIAHGYKELTIPAVDGDFAMEPHALHIWPRGEYMLIALPNADKSFTCTLFLPYEGAHSFAELQTVSAVQQFFQTYFPNAVPLMPSLTADFFGNPTSDLVTIRCYPWSRYGKNLLIGDAAHAIVPFYGQGMNAAFEDCYLFSQQLEKLPGALAETIEKFQEQRKSDADAIAELALMNFVEMRDRVADPAFLLQKKIEAELHRRYPDQWVPLYTMVTFSDRRYSEALAIGKRQEEIMQDVLKQYSSVEALQEEDYKRIVRELNDEYRIRNDE